MNASFGAWQSTLIVVPYTEELRQAMGREGAGKYVALHRYSYNLVFTISYSQTRVAHGRKSAPQILVRS